MDVLLDKIERNKRKCRNYYSKNRVVTYQHNKQPYTPEERKERARSRAKERYAKQKAIEAAIELLESAGYVIQLAAKKEG